MSATARAFFYIQQLEQLVRRRLDECLAADGVTAGQYMALNLIVHHEPVSAADLAQRANMTAQSMGEFVKMLEGKGLVERKSDPVDKRVILVSSTPAGRRVLVQCEAKIDQAEREFFSCLDPEDLSHLRLLMSRVRRAQLEQRRNGR